MTPSHDLDFSDKTPMMPCSDTRQSGAVYLRRTPTGRSVTFEDILSTGSPSSPRPSPLDRRLTRNSKWDHWMVNDGGRYIFFAVWIFLQIILALLGFLNYQLKDDLVNARGTFGVTYSVARMASLILHLDAALILLPVCRNFLSILRRSPLNHVIPFERNVDFHIATAWSMVFWTAVHIIAHLINFAKLAMLTNSPTAGQTFMAFLAVNFSTGPGVTGWLMTLCLAIIVYFSLAKQRRTNYERFWYSHHLFIVFFVCWQLHGMFCMIKPDRPPFCSWNNVGVFWRYWLLGGVIYVSERIMREVRSRHRTHITKVIQHPDMVIEIHIKKEKTPIRAGQYILLSCPEISYFQWHPFILTSAPEEDYISVHMRVVGDFTMALANTLGCNFNMITDKKTNAVRVTEVPHINGVLPRVMIDGPFGSATEDFSNYETIMLVGAGIGITPFASILKSIWYRLNDLNTSKPNRLSKVYFTWVIRNLSTVEWFHSLLQALEEHDEHNQIEITIYLTAQMQEGDINNIMLQDVNSDRDIITSLRAPTYYGRPNWDRIFGSIVDRHPNTDVGVFCCGPPSISRSLHEKCNEYTDIKGTRFFYSKENF